MAISRVRKWFGLEKMWNHLMAGFQLRLAGLHDFAKICLDAERPSRRRRPAQLELELLENRKLFTITLAQLFPLTPIEGRVVFLGGCFGYDHTYAATDYTATTNWGDGTSSSVRCFD